MTSVTHEDGRQVEQRDLSTVRPHPVTPRLPLGLLLILFSFSPYLFEMPLRADERTATKSGRHSTFVIVVIIPPLFPPSIRCTYHVFCFVCPALYGRSFFFPL